MGNRCCPESTPCCDQCVIPYSWCKSIFDGWVMAALKRKCCHLDGISITGCNASYQNDNFQCIQWWKFSSKWRYFRFSASGVVAGHRSRRRRCLWSSRSHRGEAMYISLIGFQWTSTKTKSFQQFDNSTFNYYYLHQLWKYICQISTKMY